MGAEAKKTPGTDTKSVHIDSMRHMIRESINGYVFWCLFLGLAPMIWFYPLNDLEISGYEAYAGLWFIHILAGIPLIRILIHQRHVLGVLRGLCVASLASFQASTTLTRLIILAAGNGVATLTLTASLWNPSKRIRNYTCWGMLLGFLAFVVSRVWFTTFVPTWWSNTSNTAVITIGALAVIDQFFSGFDSIKENERSVDKKLQQPYSLTTGLGFGSLMFLMNWVFGEVSIITRWTVRAYPDNGPEPYPWGICTLLALFFGAYMSACRHVSTSMIWWLIGLASFCALYYLPTWQGFTGGLVLGVYAMSVWPEMLDRVSRCPPTRTLFVAILTFMIQNFFLVWTVAYNFVPLGEYTREHTDVLIAMNMLCILVGLFTGGSIKDDGFTAYTTLHRKKVVPSSFNKAAKSRSHVIKKGQATARIKLHLQDKEIPSIMESLIKCLVLVVLLCFGLLGFGYRYNPQRYDHPVKKSPKQITTAIWTYHFGYDNKGWPSLERTAMLLNDTGADIVTMLESDASKPFLGDNDLGQWLGEKMGFYVDFGPSTKDHTWGNLILSKYPFVKSTHHLLPSPHGELAPAVTATVNVSGNLVDIVVTHMGNDRDRLDRKLQSEFLARETKNCNNPVVFMGYVTSKPGSPEYQKLINDGNMKDIDDTDRKRFCEYIMYRGLKRLGYARITHGGLSDTELQMARYEIPEDPSNYQDNTRVTYDTDTSVIPDDVKFNEKFGTLHHGHGYFPGHRFHMSTPKYFLP